MADIDSHGIWTDHIYANSQQLAKVESSKPAYVFKGTRSQSDQSCNVNAALLNLNTQAQELGAFRAGDVLSYDMRIPESDTGTYAVGGLAVFGNGSEVLDDQEGYSEWASTVTDGKWHHRSFQIGDAFAGQDPSSVQMFNMDLTPVGDWEIDYTNFVITRADGSIITVPDQDMQTSVYGTMPVSGSPISMCGSSNITGQVETIPVDSNEGTTFFVDDHLGTTQMELSNGGWPLWEGQFTPFGQEIISGSTVSYAIGTQPADGTDNRYKFTGKERDQESGLDYFGARYYGSSMGRFMSPDPLGGHLENPQSLNKYAYALNNPLTNTDPTGLDSYLQCTVAKDGSNASTCQSQTVGYDKNGKAQTATVQGVTKDGKFTATLIGNDANGNLVDKTTGTGAYTSSVNGSGVQFSNNGGQTSSTGVFVNGTPQTTFQDAGFANGGALSGFQFTLTNSKMEANQTEAGSFSFNGTVLQTESALQKAGFIQRAGTEGGIEFRSPGSGLTGANSGHFIIDNDPRVSVPTSGNMHFGEHNPYSPLGWGIHIPFEAPK